MFGIGWACILSPSIVTALSSIPETASGVATGTLFTLHNIGGAIGLALGTVAYHYQAKIALTIAAAKQHLAIGDWISQAVADPDNALSLIQSQTHLPLAKATSLLHQFFMHGYRGGMILLLVVSAGALLLLLMGLKRK